MTLTKYAWKQWLPICLGSGVLIALTSYVAQTYALLYVVAGAIALATLAVLSFYRNPWRTIPQNLPTGTMLSPADGVISAIEYVDSHESVDGKAVIVRIFLSVLNVHINRAPCDCTVQKLVYREGQFLDARTEESAKVNESNLIVLDADGIIVGLRQVSGKLAKRIICPLSEGQTLKQGQQFGMITLGSTTELILPMALEPAIHVEKGQRVKGGITLLAQIEQ
ncbi:MAG: phosphatidylserine decarboxylase [Phycisphaerales bacterium]|nr:phosphatidylserine decarboxylase [Phycisphaerales bacterium]